MSFFRGWDPLRSDDYGVLWEHLVLEFLQAHGHEWRIQYWRDASGKEVDFVIPRNRAEVEVIECKWDPEKLDPAAMKLFRSYYPKGNNYLVSPLSIPGYAKKVAGLNIYVCNPDGLRQQMESSRARSMTPADI